MMRRTKKIILCLLATLSIGSINTLKTQALQNSIDTETTNQLKIDIDQNFKKFNLSNEEKKIIFNDIVDILNYANNPDNFILNNLEIYSTSMSKPTDPVVSKYYKNNIETAQRLYGKFLLTAQRSGGEIAHIERDLAFTKLVKYGGPWDIKRFLGPKNRYLFMGNYKDGEYIGNHHYGYMGHHAGYSVGYLNFAAGVAQVWKKAKLSDYKYYFDSKEDYYAIQDGFNDWKFNDWHNTRDEDWMNIEITTDK